MFKKGQMFGSLIVLFIASLIFIFAAPTLFVIINESASGQGTATAFVMKLFLWVVFLTLIGLGFKVIASGEGLFT